MGLSGPPPSSGFDDQTPNSLAYLGLVPSSQESGEADDRKGHITRQGSGCLRWALCQAAWAAVRSNPAVREIYERLLAKNPKKKKISLVGVMRRLAVTMWHRGLEAEVSVKKPVSAPKKAGRGRRRTAAAQLLSPPESTGPARWATCCFLGGGGERGDRQARVRSRYSKEGTNAIV